MAARELAILFDLVKQTVPIVNFTGENRPAYDLYSARSNPTYSEAMLVLEAAGLVHAEAWADVTFYRLDQAARGALNQG